VENIAKSIATCKKIMAWTYPQNWVLVKYHHTWLNWLYTGGINV